jgi:hypothetical protein
MLAGTGPASKLPQRSCHLLPIVQFALSYIDMFMCIRHRRVGVAALTWYTCKHVTTHNTGTVKNWHSGLTQGSRPSMHYACWLLAALEERADLRALSYGPLMAVSLQGLLLHGLQNPTSNVRMTSLLTRAFCVRNMTNRPTFLDVHVY